MTLSDRDRLIEMALKPEGDLVVPADLATMIHAELVQAPQRRRPLASPILRRLPELPVLAGPAGVWLTALLLLGLAIVAALVVGARREPSFRPAVTSYHGNSTQDGTMPGPGPTGVAIVLHDVALPGVMDNLSLPLVRDGLAYFADLGGHVDALSAQDLSQRWHVDDLGQGSHAPILLGTTLFVVGDGGTVVALDAATGTQRWRTTLGIEVYSPLAGAGDIVLVSSVGGEVVGLSATDGGVLYRVPAGGPVNRSPAIADGVAFVAADSGRVTAFDLETGTPIWSRDLADSDPVSLTNTVVASPAYADGILYVARGSMDMPVPPEVAALDVATRSVRWRRQSPTLDRMSIGAVTADAVYTVGDAGTVRMTDLDGGTPRTLLGVPGGMGALPTVVGDTLFASSFDGVVRAIDRHTGVEAWKVNVAGQPTGPVVIDGRVYVGTSLGRAIVIGDP